MNGDLILNIALVIAFVLIGGVFARTEMALVTLRESQVNAIAARGRRGERAAALARSPHTFLSAVQIGVTVAGIRFGRLRCDLHRTVCRSAVMHQTRH